MKKLIYNNLNFKVDYLKKQRFFRFFNVSNRGVYSLFVFLAFFIHTISWSQITTTTWNFAANSTGWTGNFTRSTLTNATMCGSAAMRRNLYNFVTTGNLVSPVLPGTNNQGVVTLSYKYKTANFNTPFGAVNPWGSFNVQYGSTATGPWTTLATVSQETQNGTCITKSHTFTPPAGNVFLKWDCFWTAGDYYLSFDDITVSQAVPVGCSGTPATAVAAISSLSGCSGQNITLSTTGAAAGAGISSIWQSSTNNSTWNNITGATAASTVITRPAVLTYYRYVTTCSNSGLSANSNTITSTPLTGACECGAYSLNYASNTADEDISRVRVGTLDNSSTCATLATGNGSILNRYSNYAGIVAAPSLTQTAITSFSLTQTTCNAFTYDNFFQIYIDYNQNGSFADAGEQVYSQSASVNGNHTASGTFAVPATALTGTTRMRIVNIENVASTALYGQNVAYIYGETEDYCVTIVAPPPPTSVPNCAGAPTAPTNGQTNVSPAQILSWPAVSGATSYDVYFGTNNPPTNIVNGTNQAGITYNPGTLLSLTNYYWKIVPRNSIGAATGCSVWSFSTGLAGCANGTAFGTVTAPTDNTPVTISTAQYQSEYSTINSVSAGSVYQSSYSLGGFITVHQGTPAGPIIAYGATPLTWTATVAGTYYVHYNTSAFPGCGVASLSGTSIITCTSCPPPPTNWLAQFQSVNIGSSNWCVGEVRTVTVTVKNAGLIAWTNAAPDINIGIKWNADADYLVRADANGLAAGATGTYTFLMTAPLTVGTENLSFDVVNEANFWFANNNNGGGPGNVVYTSTGITINPYPIVTASTNTTICAGNNAALSGTSTLTFTNNVLSADFNTGAWPAGWTRTNNGATGAGTDFPTSFEMPAAAGSTWAGNGYTSYCSFFYAYWINAGVTGDMISPSMNLSALTTATLTFWIYNSDGTDVLRVYANTNNGAYAQVGATYATYGVWTQISISLNAYCGGANTNVKLKFTGTSDYGNSNIGIDDILVSSISNPTITNAWSSSPVGFTSSSLTPTVSPTATTNYTLTGTANGCASSASVTVTINNPVISPTPTSGDYIWRGSTSTGWSVPGNWYVYNGTNYVVATVASTTNDNVIIPAIGTCITQQPIVGIPGSAQNITINSGASLILNLGSTITAKNITIASTGTLAMNGAANSSLNVSGNWQDNGTFNAGVGTVNFNGTTAQSINKSSGNEVFANVIVNKASGSLTLNSPTEIGNNLTLTSGLVNSDATNLLIINDNATATGAGNTSHVVGPVRKIGDESFTFPVGKGGIYAPTAIGAPSLTTDHFTAEYFNSDPNVSYNATSKDITIDHVSACEYWMINQTAGSSAVTVNLSWDTRSCGVTLPSDLLVARWDGAVWKDHGNGGITGNNAAGAVTSSVVISNFSPFTLASRTGNNPLPIELTNFDLSCENEKVIANWSTTSELNNDFFTLERSVDGLNFESIAFIKGNGTTIYKNSYSVTDANSIDGISYYQLKQTDFNGQTKTYSLKSVDCENKNSELFIYPNPSNGAFVIQGTTFGCDLIVTDIVGKEIYNAKGNDQKTQVKLNGFASGIYYITITKGIEKITKKVVID